MELITERMLIQTVAARWSSHDPGGNSPDMQNKLKKLQKLDTDTATVEDVDAIIGNNTWTRLVCHECLEKVTEVVQISNIARICKKCALKAAASFT